MQLAGDPGILIQNISSWLLKGLDELNGFDIIHTDLKPENVALVLEPEDYPENRNISLYMERKERITLFTLEVALLTSIFQKVVKFEPLYKILFNSQNKKTEIISFLKYCTMNKSLLQFLKPPFRDKIVEKCREPTNRSRALLPPVGVRADRVPPDAETRGHGGLPQKVLDRPERLFRKVPGGLLRHGRDFQGPDQPDYEHFRRELPLGPDCGAGLVPPQRKQRAQATVPEEVLVRRVHPEGKAQRVAEEMQGKVRKPDELPFQKKQVLDFELDAPEVQNHRLRELLRLLGREVRADQHAAVPRPRGHLE